jgi:PAS domain S-box-containing protein
MVTVLSALAMDLLFMEPRGSPMTVRLGDWTELVLFTSAGGLISWMAEKLDIMKRKPAEEALRTSESTLRSIYESASVMMGVVELPVDNSDIIHIYQNPATDRFFNRPPGSVTEQSALAMGAPEGAVKRWIEHYRLAEREGRPVQFEYWHPRETGAVWLSAVVAKIGPGESGRTRFSYVVTDETERRRGEEALRTSEERLRLATLGGDLGVWDWDIARDTAYLSGRYYEMIGYQEGEVHSDRAFFEGLVHPEDLAAVESTMEAHLRGESDYSVIEYRMRMKSGEYRWIRGVGKVVARDAQGAPLRMAGVIVDITAQKDLTARKLAEEQARESARQFLLVANSAPVLLWTSGPDKLCTFFNQPWLEFRGRTLEQELGNGWAEGVHPEDLDHSLKIYTESFDARQPFTMEYRLRRHDGQYRWVSDHGMPRYDSQKTFLGYIGSCVDVTERKAAEAEAQRSQQELAHAGRVSMLGTLAGSLAHELNQPLTAIVSNAQAVQRLMNADRRDDKEMSDALQDIAEQGQRAGDVIAGMRAMLKKDPGEMAAQDLNRLVMEVLEMVRSDLVIRRVMPVLRLDPLLPPVRGHGVQLLQVLLNLVMNASEAMTDTRDAGSRQLTIGSRRATADEVEVSVADDGPGFPEEMLRHEFEPFHTTKPNGLGLGLAICRSIIATHGGRLVATNNGNKGATVKFTLPVRHEIAL